MTVIKTENLCKVYGKKGNVVEALKDVNIEVSKGEFVGYGANYIAKENIIVATIPIMCFRMHMTLCSLPFVSCVNL